MVAGDLELVLSSLVSAPYISRVALLLISTSSSNILFTKRLCDLVGGSLNISSSLLLMFLYLATMVSSFSISGGGIGCNI